MEWPVLGLARLGVRLPEELKRLVLRRRRERVVARVRQHLARLDDAVDGVLGRLVLVPRTALSERHAYLGGRLPALAGVRLVNNDRELVAAVLVADLLVDEREHLDRRDDDLLAALDRAAQVA